MATLVLAAAGGAIGGSIGGGVLGVSSLVLGKAVGATVGALIDQKLFGAGSEAVEVGRRDRLRLTGSREGAPVPRVWGRMRLGGQLIWSSGFVEDVTTTGGGKGVGPSAPEARTYAYSVSVAIAICEGEIARVARVWADGEAVDLSTLDMRVYRGDEAQLPDPLIVASVPEGAAPAFRGTAYVVIENLNLGPFGNRIPQFSFEVVRRPAPSVFDEVRGVALVPGTGEYGLATEPVRFEIGKGETKVSNVNNDEGRPDLDVALDALREEVPANRAVSLVVSWFGDDLRCGACTIRPKAEQDERDGAEMPWTVSGAGRSDAGVVSYVEGRPGFGGTPADAAVVQAIGALKARGQAVMFYPFLLMDIRAGNGLPDPWGGAEQPPVPWRGRITGARAPGLTESPDGEAAAGEEVAAFLGTAQVSDFAIDGERVVYSGPDAWSYRRFILHYAHLCAAAGGVDAFCVGSEMRSLTQLRDAPERFPFVDGLRTLAAEAKAVLPGAKIGYAADWSEYFGYHRGGDVYYNLDPLWADPAIDFVGIDNYMPLSDWRDGEGHADATAGAIYDPAYLRGNVEGGEGYDWYYASAEGRARQDRLAIEDGAYGEPWTYRYKDIRNWWSRFHWDRRDGVKAATPSPWVPESKPVWFTELGCPAVDKGTNQPNVFVDPQSSENALPYFSNGGQDRFIQQRYLEAVLGHWAEPARNPVSRVYGGRMIDLDRAFVWAWDARPFPDFPRRTEVWSDGLNHRLGHWISGRTHMVPLADVVGELCARAGATDVDVSGLQGVTAGFHVEATETARESLQPLMLAYGIDAFEREGRLVFRSRGAAPVAALGPERFALEAPEAERYELSRAPEAEVPGRVRVSFVHPEKAYQVVAAEARMPGAEALHAAGSDVPVALSHAEGEAVAARWLAETQVGRDRVRFALPRSRLDLGPGDVVDLRLDEGIGRFRIDRVEETLARSVEAVRVEPDLYRTGTVVPELIVGRPANRAGRPHVEVLDLPLLTGGEIAHAPWVAGAVVPWAGPLAIYTGLQTHDLRFAGHMGQGAVVGTTLSDLPAASPWRWAAQAVEISVSQPRLMGRSPLDVLNGANLMALRAPGAADWELVQFADATPVADRVVRLSRLLRGQAGTEAQIAPMLAAGADVVLLDGSAMQLDLPLDTVGLPRHVRVGPADQAYDDDRYAQATVTPRGVGLRPYAPAHLSVREVSGDLRLGWIRRTRIGGDGWAQEAPLGEAAERYLVEVEMDGAVARTAEVSTPAFVYRADMRAADGATGSVSFAVAQISDVWGPGTKARIIYDG